MSKIKLTQYSHGAGCGCKISPATLEEILKTNIVFEKDDRLIVGNDSKDDAAVTIRNRDTMEQERIKIDELVNWLREKIEF